MHQISMNQRKLETSREAHWLSINLRVGSKFMRRFGEEKAENLREREAPAEKDGREGLRGKGFC